MRLKKLTGKNYTSYKELEIDFTKYNKALVIGMNNQNLSDSNASGKTNLCEAIGFSIWGESRAKTLNENVNFNADECSVTIDFEHDGKNCSITRKRNKSNDSSAVDFYMDGVRSNGNSATETNEKIVNFLKVNYKTYTNSVYLKQDKNFSLISPDNKSGEGRKILEQVLNLEDYELFEKKCKEKIKNLKDKEISKLTNFIEFNKSNTEKIAESFKIIKILISQKSEKENNIEKIKIEYDILDNKFNAMKDSINLKKDLEKELVSISKIIDYQVTEKAKMLEQGKRFRSEKEEKTKTLNEKISEKNNIQKEYNEFLKLINENTIVKNNLDKKTELLNKQKAEEILLHEIYRNNDKEEYLKTDQINKKQIIIKQKNISLESSKKGIIVGEVCPTCFKDITKENFEVLNKHFKKEIENIEADIKILDKERALIVISKNTNLDKYALKHKEVEAQEQELETIKESVISEKQEKEQKEFLDKKIKQIEQYEKDLEDLNKDQSLKELKNKIIALDKDITEKNVEQKNILDKIALVVVDNEFENYENKLTDLKNSIDSENMEFYKISASLDSLKEKLENLNKIETELEQSKKSLDENYLKLKTLEQLSFAFSSKGIKSKILKDAIDDLEKESNKLLRKVSNGRLSLEFLTKKDVQMDNGEKSENIVFEVSILDGKNIVPLHLCSSGQQFRISFVIRIALSRLLLRRVNSKLEFLIIDEAVSPLDQIGVENIMEIISELQDEFKTILVITHRNDIKNMFDQVITVIGDENGSKILA